MAFLTRLAGALAALTLTAAAAAAQDYPARPITLIVPFAAGGPTDIVARIVGEHMSRTLGQQLVIENAVGAGGTTASTRAKRAAPVAGARSPAARRSRTVPAWKLTISSPRISPARGSPPPGGVKVASFIGAAVCLRLHPAVALTATPALRGSTA